MIRLDFEKPLTALEIRDPAIDVCSTVAAQHDLYAKFHQSQQAALSGHAHQHKSQRQRIGNGKHKIWLIDFQTDEPQVSRPNVVGRIILRSPIWPEKNQYGGFDYGKYGKPSPTYPYITVHTPSELEQYRPLDLEEHLLEITYSGLKSQFEAAPRLFEVGDYSL